MNKNLYKVIALILTAVCGVLMLTGCSTSASSKSKPAAAPLLSNSAVVGTWKLVGVYNEVGKRTISAEGTDSDLTLVLKSDDTYTLTGTWMGQSTNKSDSYSYMPGENSGILGSVFSTSMKTFYLNGEYLMVSMFGMQQIYSRDA